MRQHQIAVIGGDGIGPEVVAAALPVLHAVGETFGFQLDTSSFPWGCAYYLEHGRMMPADGLKQLEGFGAIFLGGIGDPSLVPDHISLYGLLLDIRRGFAQFVNMRPHRPLPGVQSPLRSAGFDILCIPRPSKTEGGIIQQAGAKRRSPPWRGRVGGDSPAS